MSIPHCFEFFSPVKISSGKKALENLPFDLRSLGAKTPFVVAGKEKKNKKPIDRLIRTFKDSGFTIGVFDGVPAQPTFDTIKQLGDLFFKSGCDAIIALGSGAVVDAAKVLNIQVSKGLMSMDRMSPDVTISTPLKPLILIPSSPGTGFETSRYASIDNQVYASEALMPDVVIIDPCMILPESPESVVSGALVALTHAVESFTQTSRNPIVDAYAHAAIQAVSSNIRDAAVRKNNKQARLALAFAEAVSGPVFSNSPPGMTHLLGIAACAHSPLSAGMFMGILLPYVLDYHLAEKRCDFDDLLLPIAGFEPYAATEPSIRSVTAIRNLLDLGVDLNQSTKGNVPCTLQQTGLAKSQLVKMAAIAATNLDCGGGDGGCLAVLENAWEEKRK